MKWQNAPGIKTGLYGWAKDASAPLAHCYRRGYGTDTALCTHKFARVIEMPHRDDRMCSVCRGKIEEIERELGPLTH